MMKIGLDLDEVTVDLMTKLLEKFNEKTGKDIKFEDVKTYHLPTSLNTSKETVDKLVDEIYGTEIHDSLPLYENGKESIHKLLSKNQVLIITSRPIKYKEKTEKWIKDNFPEHNLNILFASNPYLGTTTKTKAQICLENGIFLLLEDNADYALECAKHGIKVLLFRKPWNDACERHDNIICVENWKEAMQVIQKIQSK